MHLHQLDEAEAEDLKDLNQENMEDYEVFRQNYWEMGSDFIGMMSDSIIGEWKEYIDGEVEDYMENVRGVFQDYMNIVYDEDREVSDSGVDAFDTFWNQSLDGIESGKNNLTSREFDALSFAFYWDVFNNRVDKDHEKYKFAKDVGKQFYGKLENHLDLQTPDRLNTIADLDNVKSALSEIGDFLVNQGYLGTNFEFGFDLEEESESGKVVEQSEDEFIDRLNSEKGAAGKYVMGNPSILPSAVYLFNMTGEAQHHSSRIIEEFFDRLDIDAKERDDFDPTGHDPSDVIEIWEFNRQ